jgi:DEAD/DEAH box helicase domain-containing protein
MQSAIDILQQAARQRAQGDSSPLVFLRRLEQRSAARISHLPIDQLLAEAWYSITGQPFRQHQSLALATLRRGEPLALMGGEPPARETLHLLMHEILREQADRTALLLLPDEQAVDLHYAGLLRLGKRVARSPRAARLSDLRQAGAIRASRMVLATPAMLHGRLLRHHDRAWQPLWQQLELLALVDVHRYTGVAGAHLSMLLLRLLRLASQPPLLAATLAEVSGAEAALAALNNRPWRVIPVSDAPRSAGAFALWRSRDRLRETAMLALAFRRNGRSVHICCLPGEQALLAALIGHDDEDLSYGEAGAPAAVQIVAGLSDMTALRHSLESSTDLLLLVADDAVLERTLLRLHQDGRSPVLDDPAPTMVSPPNNAYVTAQHVLCAASERPITAEEVAHWQLTPIVERLVQRQQLARLPGEPTGWQPLPAAGDPYIGFDLEAAGSAAILLQDEQGRWLGSLDPAQFDRAAFPDAALPPEYGSYRVVARNEDTLSITLRAESQRRRTIPLRRCSLNLREEAEERRVHGRPVGWCRVIIDEEIYGYRELRAEAAPVERAIAPALHTRWTAPAIWIEVGGLANSPGQLPGWSLVYALPMLLAGARFALVPAYDAERRRLYLVDAQPGGNGFAAWCYMHLEELLPLAYDIAIDARGDPLLEPLAQADKDWLLGLLGGSVRPAVAAEPPLPAAPPVPPLPPAPPEQLPAPALPAKSAGRRNGQNQPAERSARRQAERERGTENREPRNESGKGKGRGRKQRATATEATRPEAPPVPPAPPLTPPAIEAGPVEPLPDAAAMVARLRRMREQRGSRNSEPLQAPAAPDSANARLRFAPGDQVFCLPYGYGTVRHARIENGRELLEISLPDVGDLTIDTSVNVVRRIDPETDEEPPF